MGGSIWGEAAVRQEMGIVACETVLEGGLWSAASLIDTYIDSARSGIGFLYLSISYARDWWYTKGLSGEVHFLMPIHS